MRYFLETKSNTQKEAKVSVVDWPKDRWSKLRGSSVFS